MIQIAHFRYSKQNCQTFIGWAHCGAWVQYNYLVGKLAISVYLPTDKVEQTVAWAHSCLFRWSKSDEILEKQGRGRRVCGTKFWQQPQPYLNQEGKILPITIINDVSTSFIVFKAYVDFERLNLQPIKLNSARADRIPIIGCNFKWLSEIWSYNRFRGIRESG